MILIDKVCPVCSIAFQVQASIKRPLTYCSMSCKKIDTARKRELSRLSLTAEALRELLDYNPLTGIFIHRKLRPGIYVGDLCGWRDDLGYIHIRIGVGKLYLAHRLAWLYVHGEWPKSELDHVNGDPSDNRIANLREAEHSQNMWNMVAPKHNTSGRKGVSWDNSRKQWRVTIRFNGTWKQIARVADFNTAVRLREEAEQKYHGEFARAK
jgi:hypothetical protein